MVNVALARFHGHHDRVKIHGTFNTYSFSLMRRIIVRGLLASYVNNLVKLLLSFNLLSLYGSLFFSKSISLARSVLVRPLAFITTFFFALVLGLLDTTVPT